MRQASRHWAFLVLLASAAFVACGGDDDGVGSGEGGAGQAGAGNAGGAGGSATGGVAGVADGSVEGSADGPVDDASDAGLVDQATDATQEGGLPSVPFADTFMAKSNVGSSCTRTADIVGQEPAAAGGYPLFVWTPGTGGTVDSPAPTALVAFMASKGFVAAAVDYSTLANVANMNCTQAANKASCAYDPAKTDSAISKLCARAKSDCGRGIVVAGLSQGTFMAMLAKEYDSRVRAAYLIGAGNDQSSAQWDDMSACLNAGARALPGDRVRAVNGEQDGNWVPLQGQLEGVTGNACPAGTKECFRANGSGWYLVSDSQVQDGVADHCYHVDGGCSNQSPLDTGYVAGSEPWSMKVNLDWLAGFAD
jgi:hypothetical protein